MRKLLVLLAPAMVSGMMLPAPANAAINIVASNVDLTASPFTFDVAGNGFSFIYAPTEAFDFSPVLLQTTGNAMATAFGGFLGIPLQPSTFFTGSNVEIGPDTFPTFGSFPTATEVPFSLTPGDIGLRYMIGTDSYFGYARFGGSTLTTLAFETSPNVSITAGAIPEPATWLTLILGFAAIGVALRRGRTARRPARAGRLAPARG